MLARQDFIRDGLPAARSRTSRSKTGSQRSVNAGPLIAGLVLQAKPQIDCNEFGLQQATLVFETADENYPVLVPERGVTCPKFKPGDSITKFMLADLDFLGAQTSRFILGGSEPGIGTLEVLCQGAIFDILNGKYPKYDPVDFAFLSSTTTGGDLIAPTGTITSPSTTFKFAAHAHHQLHVGLSRDGTDVGVFNANRGVQEIRVNGIPMDGRKIYVRLITALDPPSGGGTSGEQHYVFNTDPSGGRDNAPAADALDGKGFGPITRPFFQISNTLQTAEILVERISEVDTSIELSQTTSVTEVSVLVDYHSIDLRYEYVARDLAQRPRFITSSYLWDKNTDLVTIPDSNSILGVPAGPGLRRADRLPPSDLPPTLRGGGLQMQLLIDRVRVKADSASIADPLGRWREKSVLIGSGAQFEQIPAGPYFHVVETANLQLVSQLV